MTEPAGRVAAIIVTYKTGPTLFACLTAALSAPDIDEVILVDNGNPREVRAQVLAAGAGARDFAIIWGHGNVGFAAGCNRGAARATAEHLLFLNPDAIIEPGAAGRLRDTGEGGARPWIVGGMVRGMDGRESRGGRRGAVTPWTAFIEMTGLTRLSNMTPAFRSIHFENQPLPDGPIETPTVSGAFMMMRADDFAALGGFDEGYFVHVEDVDICRRVREAGGSVQFEPRASVRHVGATSDAPSMFVAYHKGRGMARYFRKFAHNASGRALAAAMAPAIVAAAVTQSAVRRVTRRRPASS